MGNDYMICAFLYLVLFISTLSAINKTPLLCDRYTQIRYSLYLLLSSTQRSVSYLSLHNLQLYLFLGIMRTNFLVALLLNYASFLFYLLKKQ